MCIHKVTGVFTKKCSSPDQRQHQYANIRSPHLITPTYSI